LKSLLLIDGNNNAHKARHTFSLTSPEGIDVSVTFGFLNGLRYGLKRFKPESCIIAWDGRIPKFRRDKIPSYKINRRANEDETYPDFIRQLQELEQLLSLTGTVNIRRHGMEADDILYQAAYLGQNKYDRIVIVSDDADLYQAVHLDNTLVYSSRKDKVIDQSYVEKQSGVPIDQYVNWRALQGDVSDNITGVPGIGPVRATKLFQKYGSLLEILEAANRGDIKGKMGERIREYEVETLLKNVYVMSLSQDKTGARKIIQEETARFRPADIKTFKKSLFSLNFISIMDGSYFKDLKTLTKPDLLTQVRAPVVCDRRFPVEA